MSDEWPGRRISFVRDGIVEVELLLDIYDPHDVALLLEQLRSMDDGEHADIEMLWWEDEGARE